jgi:hypothetical protein
MLVKQAKPELGKLGRLVTEILFFSLCKRASLGRALQFLNINFVSWEWKKNLKREKVRNRPVSFEESMEKS